jgi:WD40 repeat protein
MQAGISFDGHCSGLTFSDDGRFMAAATELERGPGSISVWKISDQSKINTFPASLYVMAVGTGFATSGDMLHAAYQDRENGKLCLMDLHNGVQQWSVEAGDEYVTALAFSPDGKILASGTGFNKSPVRLWNVADGTAIGEMTGHDSWVSSLVFWPDGKKLASSSADQTIKIWDVASRKCLDTLRGHRAEVWRLALLPDGKTLISGGKDGSVCFWDASVSHTVSSSESTITNVVDWAFAPDNQSIVTLEVNGEVARRRGLDYGQKEVLFGTGASNFNVEMSQDGNWLVDIRGDKTHLWDVAHRSLSQTWTNAAEKLRMSGNGNKLLRYSENPLLFREFDARSGAEIQSWRPAKETGSIIYSFDGSTCVAMQYEYGEIAVRNLETQTNLELKTDLIEVQGGAFSPDGKLCVFTSGQGYARVFDTADWRPVATLGGFANGTGGAAFSPDGKRLAVTSVGRQAVRIWETEGWQNVMELEYNGGGLVKVAFSPDGDTLAAVSAFGEFHVWRTPSWEEINTAETKEKNEAKLP